MNLLKYSTQANSWYSFDWIITYIINEFIDLKIEKYYLFIFVSVPAAVEQSPSAPSEDDRQSSISTNLDKQSSMSNSLDTLLEEDTYRVPERLPISELPANNLPDLGSTPLFWPDFQSPEYWRAGSATADYSSGKNRNCFEV